MRKTPKRKGPDMVNAPPHYRQGQIEVIDFIVDQKMDYCLGNAIKYLARYRFKGSPVEDLKKAKFYINKLIKKEEALGKKQTNRP